jgi:hypothetical protein
MDWKLVGVVTIITLCICLCIFIVELIKPLPITKTIEAPPVTITVTPIYKTITPTVTVYATPTEAK